MTARTHIINWLSFVSLQRHRQRIIMIRVKETLRTRKLERQRALAERLLRWQKEWWMHTDSWAK